METALEEAMCPELLAPDLHRGSQDWEDHRPQCWLFSVGLGLPSELHRTGQESLRGLSATFHEKSGQVSVELAKLFDLARPRASERSRSFNPSEEDILSL